MRGALLGFLNKTGITLPQGVSLPDLSISWELSVPTCATSQDQGYGLVSQSCTKPKELRTVRGYRRRLWAAVYPGNGGRHGCPWESPFKRPCDLRRISGGWHQ